MEHTRAQSLADFGARLGVHAPERESVAYRVVEQLNHNKGWLLIYDDAGNVDDLIDLIPVGDNGTVIIASRNPQFEELAEALLLEPFPAKEAAEFLRVRSGDLGGTSAEESANSLEGLPLALEQAGAYCRDAGIGIAQYLERYRAGRGKILHSGPQARKVGLATTFRLSYDRAKRVNLAAPQWMKLCSFMAVADIPRDLLSGASDILPRPLADLARDSVTFDQVVSALRQTSLITSAAPTHLRIHQLVSDLMREYVISQQGRLANRLFSPVLGMVPWVRIDPTEGWSATRWIKLGLRVLARNLPIEDPKTPEHWAIAAALFPHVQELSKRLDELNVSLRTDEVKLYTGLEAELGIRLYRGGEYLLAEELCRHAHAVARQHLPDYDPHTRRLLFYLAQTWTGLGRLDDARTACEQLLSIVRDDLGEEHLETVAVMNDLAGILMEMEDRLEQAEMLLRHVLAVRETALGERHALTVSAVNNLGKVLRRRGKIDEAYAMAARAVRLAVETLGPDHPNSLIYSNNLGEVCRVKERLDAARQIHADTLERRARVLGETHPLTVVSMNNLARILRLQGQLSSARGLYARALELAERALGSSHPHTIAAQNGLREVARPDEEGAGGENGAVAE
ncbi:tetratricopeptide repeat protein [Thermopolyspora sp. NPDC052614]|uniref:tetratricopeptide repeat protein n=1 Tax=Thermopolyspora sp. NPDC052614 TaxID=3155682 RepID=UPI003412B212